MYKIPLDQAPNLEMQILREFLRRINNYQEHFRSTDTLECLSFIQHFGGPTRLLDWTYSFYIAAFFALSSATLDSQAAIWCFRSTVWDDYHDKRVFFTEEGELIHDLEEMKCKPYSIYPKSWMATTSLHRNSTQNLVCMNSTLTSRIHALKDNKEYFSLKQIYPIVLKKT
jgi:hypothetical protein